MTAPLARTEDGIRFATDEEGRALFDHQARALLGISGEEFIERWDRGEYRDVADGPDHLVPMRLVMLIPFGRQNS